MLHSIIVSRLPFILSSSRLTSGILAKNEVSIHSTSCKVRRTRFSSNTAHMITCETQINDAEVDHAQLAHQQDWEENVCEVEELLAVQQGAVVICHGDYHLRSSFQHSEVHDEAGDLRNCTRLE